MLNIRARVNKRSALCRAALHALRRGALVRGPRRGEDEGSADGDGFMSDAAFQGFCLYGRSAEPQKSFKRKHYAIYYCLFLLIINSY